MLGLEEELDVVEEGLDVVVVVRTHNPQSLTANYNTSSDLSYLPTCVGFDSH